MSHVQVLLLALLGYLSYLLADELDLSAILSVFFCGVTMSHYTWHSMCPAAQALALHTFRLAAGSCNRWWGHQPSASWCQTQCVCCRLCDAQHDGYLAKFSVNLVHFSTSVVNRHST